MPFNAKVIRIMIASPGDVTEERKIAREVIHSWNKVHSEKDGIILLPIGWEDAHAESGESGQDVINSQLLNDSDLLIGVFWTRLGMQTSRHQSGTVGEIFDHIKSGKIAMVYFSDKDVSPSQIEAGQYEKVRKFKQDANETGLGYVDTFKSSGHFRTKLFPAISAIINKYFSRESIKDDEAATNDLIQLSDLALEMLKATAQSNSGSIARMDSNYGIRYIAGSEEFGLPNDNRSQAEAKSAFSELINNNFIEVQVPEGDIFSLNKKGYEFYDRIINAPTSHNETQELSGNEIKYLKLTVDKGPISLVDLGSMGQLSGDVGSKYGDTLNNKDLKIFHNTMTTLSNKGFVEIKAPPSSMYVDGRHTTLEFDATIEGITLRESLTETN